MKILKAGWKNLTRNKGSFLATIFITVITVSLIGGLYLLRGTTNFLVASLQEKVDISVYFKKEVPENEILAVKEEISEIPEVKNVEYISQEEALNIFKERHKDNPVIIESLEEIGENPLLAHLNIKARLASQYEQVSSFLENAQFKDDIDKVDYYQNKTIIEKLFSIASTINMTSIVFILVSAILALLVAFNTIRLEILHSKEEITIMRLVGASSRFIRGPFIAQGIIAGFLSFLLAIVIFSLFSWGFTPKVSILVSDFNLFSYFKDHLFALAVIQLIAGVGLGTVSSLIATHKYLKV